MIPNDHLALIIEVELTQLAILQVGYDDEYVQIALTLFPKARIGRLGASIIDALRDALCEALRGPVTSTGLTLGGFS